MGNHVHLLLTPRAADSCGQLMKNLGQRYVQYINRTYCRSGTLWEGRFRSCLVESDSYLLACHRYIELNPVRAGIVAHPRDYPWSSYRHNAEGRPSSLLTAHAEYLQLGDGATEQRGAYSALFAECVEPQQLAEIRDATNGGFVLGGKPFQGKISQALGRRVAPARAGRPHKRPGAKLGQSALLE